LSFGGNGEEVDDVVANGLTELKRGKHNDKNEKGNGNGAESRALFEIKVADFLRLEPEAH